MFILLQKKYHKRQKNSCRNDLSVIKFAIIVNSQNSILFFDDLEADLFIPDNC
jgi:hypothetical protein